MEHDDSDHVGIAFFTKGADGPGPFYEAARITYRGAMAIGTTNPGSYMLAVEGKIGAREIVVTEVNPFPDYVFESDYKLPSLKDIETHIKTNRHLPEIPSAAEVAENGMLLGELQVKLLKKIEELTLYTIRQEKALAKLEKEKLTMEKRLKNLETILLSVD